MPNLSIKNVPVEVVEKLRLRAERNHRSLQGELMELVCRSTEEAVEDENSTTRTDQSSTTSGWLSIDELAADLGTAKQKSARTVPLAVDIIRQERDSR